MCITTGCCKPVNKGIEEDESELASALQVANLFRHWRDDLCSHSATARTNPGAPLLIPNARHPIQL
jgi:hypothetical protein